MTADIRTNNKWRRRIIRLLDELLVDLQCRPPSSAQVAVIEELTASSDRADSSFQGIESVETTESLYYTSPIELPETADPVVYRLENRAEDAAFAIYCLLQDATYLRLFSARAWREFALGTIGIQTATFCTNAALAKIELMSQELRETIDCFNESNTTRMHTKVDAFFRGHCCHDELVPSPDTISPDCEDIHFARHAKRRLGYHVRTLSCVRVTRLAFEAFLVSPGQYWGDTQDDMRLLKSIYQLRVFEWQNDLSASIFKNDCMYSAATALVLSHIDTGAAFAAQMLWDIQQQLDPQAVDIEVILEQVGRDYHRLYQCYLKEWHPDKVEARQRSQAKRMLEQYIFLKKTTDGIGAFQDFMDRWEKATGRQCALPGFRLMRHIPMLVGQLVAQYRYEFQQTFLDIANDQGHVLTAIHLYNAAKTSGALETTQWEDMEWVIEHQSIYSIFAGEPPATSEEYASRLCLVYGLDQTKLAIDRKRARSGRVKDNVCLKHRSPSRLESSAQYVRTYSKLHKAGGVVYKSLTSQARISVMEEFADTRLDRFSLYGEPSNIGILIAAKEAYESDEEALRFDIFDFHLRCRRLLRSIRDLCLEEAPEDYPIIRFGGEEGINPTVAELFLDLTACTRRHDRMWPKAVKLLRDMIEKEGVVCSDMAWARTMMTTLQTRSDSDCSNSDAALETPPPGPAGQGLGSDDREPGASRLETPGCDDGSYVLGEISNSGPQPPDDLNIQTRSPVDTMGQEHLERVPQVQDYDN